ncbi:hypothetical protein [Agrobacterium tumefaciens]|uniref:DUF7940 domain-containing protein n=1 Tax=Agrobacterium tumefaciens TaxID=358 RepID=UPI003B9F049C
MKLFPELVPDWRSWWRMWTIWFQGAAALFFSYLTAVPDAAFQIWAILPSDIRSSFPPAYVQYGGIVLIFLGILARLVKQPKLEQLREARMGQSPERDGRVSEEGARPGDLPGNRP